jgi:glycosyltransferase involved in cell wall biosynthesis
LGKALVELGHEVTLIAHPDSCVSGIELHAWTGDVAVNRDWERLIPSQTDVVHLRGLTEVGLRKPFVITVGGNGKPGQRFHRNTIFVSRSHAERHGSRHFVYNGLDPAEYECSPRRDDYAVFLAKASWAVKNLPGAIQVARRAGLELRVLGSRNWPLNLQRWWSKWGGVKYYGMVGQEEKRHMLAKARCLVFPVRWHEPCANAVHEALASGCYILGTPYGMLPEIVVPSVGRLSIRADELAEAARRPQDYSPAACRQRIVIGGYTHLDMARAYLRYYATVWDRGFLGAPSDPIPHTLDSDHNPASSLLSWNE